MTGANLFGNLLFSSIGLGAFLYGKKQAHWKAMVIGVALIAYPYFVPSTAAMYMCGAALTVALFVFRD
jgi:predicted phage tail protein